MKKVLVALSLMVLGSAQALEGHNGIRFDMKREDLEKMGFMCRESSEERTRGQIRCAHMEMIGRAFSQNLERYRVEFDKHGDIEQIMADVHNAPTTLSGFLRIAKDIEEFFPIEHEFDAEFKKRMPLVHRYMNLDGADIQLGYLQYSRTTSIIFYPKGTFKP